MVRVSEEPPADDPLTDLFVGYAPYWINCVLNEAIEIMGLHSTDATRPIVRQLISNVPVECDAQLVRVFRGASGPSSHELLMHMALVAPRRELLKNTPAVADKPGGLLGREFLAIR